ncbi:hypothetical protein JHD50_05490 [Sulfurimonas sp. MAG313]|nr:hypothetical protein [Sulfurimonas sp. MAG313]MDF1880761.1 hypothetical protein [Sulfurimonas sp. MAG313]
MNTDLLTSFPLEALAFVSLFTRFKEKREECFLERRKSQRRYDRRSTYIRRRECSLEDSCDTENKRQYSDDRRDRNQDKRRYERRALERVKKLS